MNLSTLSNPSLAQSLGAIAHWARPYADLRQHWLSFEDYCLAVVGQHFFTGTNAFEPEHLLRAQALAAQVMALHLGGGDAPAAAGPSDPWAGLETDAIAAFFESLEPQLLARYLEAARQVIDDSLPDDAELSTLRERVQAQAQRWQQEMLDLGPASSLEQLRQRCAKIDQRLLAALAPEQLAGEAEREPLMVALDNAVPGWLKTLSAVQQQALQQAREALLAAERRLQAGLEHCASLEGYARHWGQTQLRERQGVWLGTDHLMVLTRYDDGTLAGEIRETLTSLLARCPIAPSEHCKRVLLPNPWLPEITLEVSSLLAGFDPREGFARSLAARMADASLLEDLQRVSAARAGLSALLAMHQGHLSEPVYSRVQRLMAGAGLAGERVATLKVETGGALADLMVFYRPGSEDALPLALYAPGNPKGQEWVELNSERAVAAELGGWLETGRGRLFMLSKLLPQVRARASELLSEVAQLPHLWSLSQRVLHDADDFAAGLRRLAEHQLQLNLQMLQISQLPSWYLQMPAQVRAEVGQLAELLALPGANPDLLVQGIEPFDDFAKRTVSEAIAPYLASHGITYPVDPETIEFRFESGNAFDHRMRSESLMTLAIMGLDDNAGLERPQVPVFSTVGDDLSALRAADLIRYVRSSYLAEPYEAQIRRAWLDSRSDLYLRRRRLFTAQASMALQLQARILFGQGVLQAHEEADLLRLAQRLRSPRLAGVARLRVGPVVFQGVWVLRISGRNWVYAPGSPDGLDLRRFEALPGALHAEVLAFFTAFAPIGQAEDARRMLANIAKGERELDEPSDWLDDFADEFDAYIEAHLANVTQANRSAHKVRKAMVGRMFTYCAIAGAVALPALAPVVGGWYAQRALSSAYDAWQVDDDLTAGVQLALGLSGVFSIGFGLALHASPALNALMPKLVQVGHTPPVFMPTFTAGSRSAMEAASGLPGKVAARFVCSRFAS
ncbi:MULTISPECIES: hypothetical protein [unclassified Pseudomonas]|uniref:hypothetical protein n=1 Tax=unclassified Pseudomonas TaxID=196821 RepID=UPI000BD2C1A0|nr:MULTISPECIES: hypothetical protein [unclassified Pseudomonas]PVZ09769.1 hypothetical protein F474_04342 [Pseudomonas sp. URIL14HWK12:I12]PVZ21475.1 hypothetical protein F470_04270 [Pseudomonas sp. URIL14HWK12:I10]PVZ30344.1 hypothetical protein F472_04345 [Pseudomonas sp. URIL14HWK12:I11]SNZ18641.1 hypothetical protein SAMN05660463_04219 [Pseudomonas sp. URIL14HWK12:I9]